MIPFMTPGSWFEQTWILMS